MGVTDDWPLHVCGDEETMDKLIYLLNEVQREIKASGLDSIDRSYSPGGSTASLADYEIWYAGPQREGDYE
jgi:hypothetical protein